LKIEVHTGDYRNDDMWWWYIPRSANARTMCI